MMTGFKLLAVRDLRIVLLKAFIDLSLPVSSLSLLQACTDLSLLVSVLALLPLAGIVTCTSRTCNSKKAALESCVLEWQARYDTLEVPGCRCLHISQSLACARMMSNSP